MRVITKNPGIFLQELRDARVRIDNLASFEPDYADFDGFYTRFNEEVDFLHFARETVAEDFSQSLGSRPTLSELDDDSVFVNLLSEIFKLTDSIIRYQKSEPLLSFSWTSIKGQLCDVALTMMQYIDIYNFEDAASESRSFFLAFYEKYISGFVDDDEIRPIYLGLVSSLDILSDQYRETNGLQIYENQISEALDSVEAYNLDGAGNKFGLKGSLFDNKIKSFMTPDLLDVMPDLFTKSVTREGGFAGILKAGCSNFETSNLLFNFFRAIEAVEDFMRVHRISDADDKYPVFLKIFLLRSFGLNRDKKRLEIEAEVIRSFFEKFFEVSCRHKLKRPEQTWSQFSDVLEAALSRRTEMSVASGQAVD